MANDLQPPQNAKHIGWIFLGTTFYAIVGPLVLVLLVLTIHQGSFGIAKLMDGRVVHLDGLPGSPVRIAASPDGSLWASTTFRGSLSRLANDRWQIFRRGEFGTESNYVYDFTLDGTTVWAVVDRKLLRHQGGQWKTLSEIPGDKPFRSMAGSGGRVWLLADGQIFEFDGQKWETQQLAERLAGLPAPDDSRWQQAGLLATGEGSLWLAAGGLWRYRDGDWSGLTVDGQHGVAPRIVGWDGSRIWIADGTTLRWTSPDRLDQGSFSCDRLGLMPQEEITSVVTDSQGRVLAGTTSRVLAYHGERWRPLHGEEVASNVAGFRQLAQAPGGTYAVVREPFAFEYLVGAAFVAVALSAIMIGGLRSYRPPSRKSAAFYKAMLGTLGLMLAALFLEMPDQAGVTMEQCWLVGLTLLATAATLAPAFYTAPWLLSSRLGAGAAAPREDGSDEPEVQRFDPIDDASLPDPAARMFHRREPDLLELGFLRIGQYRQKRSNLHVGRHYYHDGFGMFAALEWCKLGFLAIRNCSFVTLLDDGTYLESGNGAPMGHRRCGAFQQRSFFALSPQRLFERHLEELRKLEQQQGASALVLREESLQSVTLYGLKLLYDDMVRRGIVQSNPYAELDLKTLAERIDAEEATELLEEAGSAR